MLHPAPRGPADKQRSEIYLALQSQMHFAPWFTPEVRDGVLAIVASTPLVEEEPTPENKEKP